MIRKNDIFDTDIIDAYELLSDGYSSNSVYITIPIIFTLSPNLINLDLAFDGNGIKYTKDHPVQSGDIVRIYGTSFGLADGYYTVDSILDNTNFTINQTLTNSTDGFAEFRYKSGSLNVGFDPRNTYYVNHNNVQQAIEDLDTAIANSGGGTGITPAEHEILRQLIHLADGVGGPFEGFTSGTYRENLPASILPTSITWYRDFTKTRKIVEKTISYLSSLPSTIQWQVFANDGTTILATALDTISYSGMFESSRVRTIVEAVIPTGNLNTQNHKFVRQLIHLASGVGGPFEGFASGAVRITSPVSPFPTNVTWFEDITQIKKIVSKTIAYNINNSVSSISWEVYDTDGVTILATVTDNIVYSGIIETSRTRNIV